MVFFKGFITKILSPGENNKMYRIKYNDDEEEEDFILQELTKQVNFCFSPMFDNSRFFSCAQLT